MKTFFITLFFFTLLVAACNTKKADGATDQEAKEVTISTTLTDLSAVTDIKKLLCQNWENKEDAEDAALSGGSGGIETTYRGFSFFEDATVVENPRDKIRFGKWSLDDATKTITIEPDKSARAQYKIVAIGARQMILMNMNDKKKTEYRSDAKAQKKPADDPFYGSNNLWRIKPAHSEAEEAIKQRTEQCVLFYAKFLEDNAGRGGNIISFSGLPTCFKWYRGGVSVISENKLETAWLNCYYDDAQALKAHAMLDKIISKKYKWKKEEKNWVKQSADVVKQMYDTLRLISAAR